MKRLSVSEFSTYRWSFYQDVIQFSLLGCNSIGVWRNKVEDFGYEEAAQLLHEMQMSVSSLSWAGGFTGSCGLSYKDSIEDAMNAVYQAHMIGADCLVIHPGGQNGHTKNHARRLFRSAINEVLPFAIDLGIRLAIEPVLTPKNPWNFYCDFQSVLNITRMSQPEHIGIVLDLYHLGHEQKILSSLHQFRDRIALVQLSDTKLATQRDKCPNDDSRCLLGHGSLLIDQWLKRLVEIDYSGAVEIEIHGREVETMEYQDVLRHACEFLKSTQVPVGMLTLD